MKSFFTLTGTARVLKDLRALGRAVADDYVRDKLLERGIRFDVTAGPVTCICRVEQRIPIAFYLMIKAFKVAEGVKQGGRDHEYLFCVNR